MVDQQFNFLHFCVHLTYHQGHAFCLNILYLLVGFPVYFSLRELYLNTYIIAFCKYLSSCFRHVEICRCVDVFEQDLTPGEL